MKSEEELIDSRVLPPTIPSICFDKKTKQPAWVFQITQPDHSVTSLSNNFKDYYQDISIPKHQQASEEDYENSKWVVGNYLFPFPKDMKKWTDENPNDQYLFSVTSPQKKELNQGYWEKLNDRVKQIYLNKKGDLNPGFGVFSGPLFLVNESEELRFLGKNKIPVPTHFFVIIIPNSNGEYMEAYVIPNEKIQEKTPLKNFEVPLKKLKTLSGIKGIENVNNLMFL